MISFDHYSSAIVNIVVDLFLFSWRIGQVIYNLLNNAIKFTQGGSISINVVKKRNGDGKDNSQQEAIVSIKDTGIGIAPEIMPRLFTKFATKSEKGMGLGLFISKSILNSFIG
jgi:two-component system, OmpR family, sensor histidine kinase VicK